MILSEGNWSIYERITYSGYDFARNLIKTKQALQFVKNCYQHYLIKTLIKKLFAVHYLALLSNQSNHC